MVNQRAAMSTIMTPWGVPSSAGTPGMSPHLQPPETSPTTAAASWSKTGSAGEEALSIPTTTSATAKQSGNWKRKYPTMPTVLTSTRRLPGEKNILPPSTTPTATRPASGPRQVSGKSVTTPTTAPLSSPARMAERPSLAATTTREGASRRKSPSMEQYPAIAGTCTEAICR